MSGSKPPALGRGGGYHTRYVNNALTALCVYHVQRYRHNERELSKKMKPTTLRCKYEKVPKTVGVPYVGDLMFYSSIYSGLQ